MFGLLCGVVLLGKLLGSMVSNQGSCESGSLSLPITSPPPSPITPLGILAFNSNLNADWRLTDTYLPAPGQVTPQTEMAQMCMPPAWSWLRPQWGLVLAPTWKEGIRLPPTGEQSLCRTPTHRKEELEGKEPYPCLLNPVTVPTRKLG